jgi:outer membrane protein TolC
MVMRLNNKYVFKFYLLLTGILCWVAARGQVNDTLSLEKCFTGAIDNYPQIKDKVTLREMSELRLTNIGTSYLPQLALNGQATYQSSAIDINLPLPGNPISIHQAKDQYKVTLDASQLIYDGGTTRYQRLLEQSSLAADQQQVDVDIYKVKEQVNSIYFTILSLQETRKQLQITLSELNEREKVMASSVKNGALTESDLDNLVAERLKVEQQISDVAINKTSAIRILGLYLNTSLSDSVKLILPHIVVADTGTLTRPEYKLFELQQDRLDASRKLTGAALKPRISAFAQAGYGRPGLNMLDDAFSTYYIIGASLKWTLWDWNKNHREREIIEVNKKSIDARKETFDKNLNIDLQNRLASIAKLEDALKRDTVIVGLRSKVAQTSASRLDHGIINTTDYLADINAETIAKISLENHKIQLQQAKAAYLIAKGADLP